MKKLNEKTLAKRAKNLAIKLLQNRLKSIKITIGKIKGEQS